MNVVWRDEIDAHARIGRREIGSAGVSRSSGPSLMNGAIACVSSANAGEKEPARGIVARSARMNQAARTIAGHPRKRWRKPTTQEKASTARRASMYVTIASGIVLFCVVERGGTYV
jgi:hypothetical protein